MGLFDDDAITTAKGTEGGVYFLPGTYLVEILRCKEGKTFTQKKFFVAECKILESDNPERKVGSPCSFMVTFDKYPELSLGNVADFLRVALVCKLLQQANVDIKADKLVMTKEMAQDCVNEKNELVGVQVRVFAFNKPKKDKADKEPFTRHKWLKTNESFGETLKASLKASEAETTSAA